MWSRWFGWVKGRRGKRDRTDSRSEESEGQATLEYVLVALGVTAVVLALGALVQAGKRGALARLSIQAASHVVGGSNPADALLDVLLY